MDQSSNKRIPCVLLMNDIHISNSNIPEFTANWMEAVNICNEMNIKTILIGGDLFQSRSSQTLDILLAVNDAFEISNSHGIQIVLANGNHDKVNQESIRGYGHLFNQHPNVTVVDEYFVYEGPNSGFIVHIMPYFPENGSFTDRLNTIADNIDWKKSDCHILYIHEGINGELAYSSDKELPTDIFEDFDSVLVGHYHNRKAIEGTKIEYIGSSRQHNFGEDEAKGYTVIMSDGSYNFIQNEANTKYKVREINYSQINEDLASWLKLNSQNPLVKIKLKISCTKEEAPSIDKQKLLEAGANKVEIIVDEQEVLEAANSSLYVKFNKDEMINIYKEFCDSKGLENNMGINYLSNIDAICGN